MDIIKLKKEIGLYTDIEELPIKRYNAFNKFLFMESEVGSDLEDLNRHLGIIAQVADDKEKLKEEIENLYQLFGFLNEDINVTHLAFAALVGKIGGEERNDLTRKGLERTLEELNELDNILKDSLAAEFHSPGDSIPSIVGGLFVQAESSGFAVTCMLKEVNRIKRIMSGVKLLFVN